MKEIERDRKRERERGRKASHPTERDKDISKIDALRMHQK